MNADQVRALVAVKWPEAMQSPVALAIHAGTNAEQADALRVEALAYAKSCIESCGGWCIETLGHNVESNFGGELSADECDDIAAAALAA